MQVLLDIFINILPSRLARKLAGLLFGQIDYCFLVHARNHRDLYRRFSFLKFFPTFLTKLVSRFLFPIRAGYIYGVNFHNKQKKGVFVGSPMDADDMLNNRDLAEKKIIRATKFAEKLGVKHVGLGALSASFTKNGLSLVDKVDCLVTTGHSLTTWIVSQNAIEVQKIAGKKLVLAIVGAGGSIGSSCFSVLKDHFERIILIDKDLDKLNSKVNLSDSAIIKYSTHLEDIRSADIIITVTNAPYAIINDVQQLSEGTIVIDDAQPMNVSKHVNSKKHKTLVIEGGVCYLSGLHYNLNLNLLDKGDMFSCMGELVALSALDSNFVTIGDTNEDKVLKVAELAKSVGIRRARFRSFGKPINESCIKTLF